MVHTIAVAGATGFIGSACVAALRDSWIVLPVPAPRFTTTARSVEGLKSQLDLRQVDNFAERYLDGVDVLVNAAGLATATSLDLSAMLGANALLPLFLARAGRTAGVRRIVHLSSAAVQGRRTLDESEALSPESSYASSKALGEQALRTEQNPGIIRYRPTSVQGGGRAVTRSLVRLAQSPAAAVAAPGNDPSPQTSVRRVAQAVWTLSDLAQDPPPVVLHPWEGTTTREVLAELGGKEPMIVNRTMATKAVATAYACARLSPRLQGHARRLDMMMFGQAQGSSWLQSRIGRLEEDWLRNIRAEFQRRGGAVRR